MVDQKTARGSGLVAIGLFFGVRATGYPLGHLANAGPGLFPLMVSVVVGLIGLAMLVQARFEARRPMTVAPRNAAIVLASLLGFVLISEHLDMALAIVWLVFVSTLAGSDWSLSRNLKITAVLLAIAFAFQRFLGLNLPML